MKDSCARFDLLLMVYADGEATPQERTVVETHIQRCPSCAERLTEWEALSRHTRALIGSLATPRAGPAVAARSMPALTKREYDTTSTGARRRPASPAAGDGRLDTGAAAAAKAAARRTVALGLAMSLVALVALPMALSRHGRLANQQPAPASSQVTAHAASLQSAQAARTPAASAPAVATASATATTASAPTANNAAPGAARAVQLTGQIAAVVGGSLHLYDANGAGQLTPSGLATAPRWSPSGRWLLYESTGPGAARLWLLQPGRNAAAWPLPAPASSGLARWSPSRDEIAVAVRDGSLWLVPAGSDQLRSLLPAGGQVTNMAWSPDGSQLAVERRGVGSAAQSIWLVSRSGSISAVPLPGVAAPALTDGSATASPPPPGERPAVAVLGSWAPGNAGFTFWLASGSQLGASTPAPLALWSRQQGARSLLPAVLKYRDFVSWAPDGHALAAVASVYAPDYGEMLGQITVVPAAPQGKPQQLTDPGRADGDAAWSPDGKLIAYASSVMPPPGSTRSITRRIWLEAPDGSDRRPISSGPQDSFPQWSKDGTEILYVHQTVTGAQLWLVGRDGSDPHPVVDGIVGVQQLPEQNVGRSGLVSYRGVFAWSAAAGGG